MMILICWMQDLMADAGVMFSHMCIVFGARSHLTIDGFWYFVVFHFYSQSIHN